MRIAQIAPLHECVPPKLYGGTERVVAALTDELVRRGHDVTLFATADSTTTARLVPMAETGARLGGTRDTNALHMAMLEEIYDRASEFDVIHSHLDVLAFPFTRLSGTPTIHTMHGRLDLPEQHRVLERFRDQRLVSISQSQRAPVLDLPLCWAGTVYNGISLEHFSFWPIPDLNPYLVFLGRIAPEKGPLEAIEVARRAGLRLKIAAKIDPTDKAWAEQHVVPLFDLPGVEYLGEVDEAGKAALLGGALGVLFPVTWPEPFGLVMTESLACGTPVVALPGGSVREVLTHGETGFICKTVDEMVEAVARLNTIDRRACRLRVEALFSAEQMALGYEAVFEATLAQQRPTAEDLLIEAGILPSLAIPPDSLPGSTAVPIPTD